MLAAVVLLLVFSVGTVLGRNNWLSGSLLSNLLPQNKFRPLEWLTRNPQITHVAIPYTKGHLNADLYLPAKLSDHHTVLLSIQGVNKNGKDDPRPVNAGQSFARSEFITLIPDFPNISLRRFTPRAEDEIVSVYSWLTLRFAGGHSGMIAFSVGAGPMYVAAADERISHQFDFLVSFGAIMRWKTCSDTSHLASSAILTGSGRSSNNLLTFSTPKNHSSAC